MTGFAGGPAVTETLESVLQGRVDIDPERVEQGLVKLVLMVVETLRQVIERQAIRRVEAGALTDEEIERLGLTLLRLEEKMAELRVQFNLSEADLSLKLRLPLGEL
ncbi:gas vesicle protein K [Aquabacter spiritensis]|uniref:Gas vesicle protein GvpK n=1 Tax=Aquabacter spiritensis TaxID=933073 RepID=A0A4R3LP67_9HYPH|nr:gas vesicle protein K [Aquabacter spiritensis]TCT02273.1 gas vesicle protein GvpK [Aquabacter spiritensis]